MTRTPWRAALPLALWIVAAWGLGPVAGPSPAAADEDDAPDPPAAPALPPAEAAKAKAAFDDALATQERGQYLPARKKFRAFLEAWPGADEALRQEAEERSAENSFLGLEEVRHGGKSENRIDIELMGDGYLITQQDKFKKHAEQQMVAFWAEPLYDEYASYFNLWRFDLASKEEGVDDPGAGPQDQTPPPPPPPPKPGKRSKAIKTRQLHQFSTALNCQAAGPQRQVWADPEMVFKWRKYLKVSDGLSLVFAKKGELGMGGMGIATTGRLVAVVHEFGHAFVGLLDEYANQAGPPEGRISAANAVSGTGPKDPPVPQAIPWRHWLQAQNPDVGVLLGGATYTLGVWRPAATCAMNSGGSSPYCWVCREAGVLRIYEYVSPIDEATPDGTTVRIAEKSRAEFSVVPMEPKTHKLDVAWFFEKLKSRVATRGDDDDDEPERKPLDEPPPPAGEEPLPRLTPDGKSRGPVRGYYRHADPWPPGDPRGTELQATEKRSGGARKSTVVLEGLATGRYRLTCRVKDDTKIPGLKWPWVLRDPDKILEERREWIVIVGGEAPKPPK
jgi:hypothetical protein